MELVLCRCGAWEGGKGTPGMSVTGIPYPCKGTCESWVCLLLWEGSSCFCFQLRAGFIPPPSAGERNLSPGQSHFLFSVGSADPREGLCEQTAG